MVGFLIIGKHCLSPQRRQDLLFQLPGEMVLALYGGEC
jgi:hypothetical protein